MDPIRVTIADHIVVDFPTAKQVELYINQQLKDAGIPITLLTGVFKLAYGRLEVIQDSAQMVTHVIWFPTA